MPDLVERLYSPDDLPGLRVLWSLAYEPDVVERRATAFRWVTERNPLCPGGSPRYLVVDGTKVVGSLGSMPVHLRAGERRFDMHFSFDLLVDPSYRGLGLAKKLARAVMEGAPSVAGGIWMTEPCYALHQSVGWEAVQPFHAHWLALDGRALLERRVRSRIGVQLLAPAANAVARLSLRRIPEARLPAAEIECFDERVDDLFERCSPSLGLMVERSAPYLNWKYVESPNASYRRFMLGDASSPDAYVVVRIDQREGGHRDGVIVDLLADPGHPHAFDAAVATAVEAVRADGAEILHILTTYPGFRERLEAMGFRKSPRQHTYVIAGVEHLTGLPDPREPSNWYLTRGDSDGDMWAEAGHIR